MLDSKLYPRAVTVTHLCHVGNAYTEVAAWAMPRTQSSFGGMLRILWACEHCTAVGGDPLCLITAFDLPILATYPATCMPLSPSWLLVCHATKLATATASYLATCMPASLSFGHGYLYAMPPNWPQRRPPTWLLVCHSHRHGYLYAMPPNWPQRRPLAPDGHCHVYTNQTHHWGHHLRLLAQPSPSYPPKMCLV